MTQRILFLDVDGVLNSKRWYDDPRSRGGCRVENLDPEPCACLHRVVRETSCRVVLSSSWRYVTTPTEMRRMLEERGVSIPFLDRTPTAPEMVANPRTVTIPGHPGYRMFENEVRGHEIQRWIDLHADLVDTFAIVDDDADMAHLAHRLVRTDNAIGLSDANADALIAMLSEAL